MTDWNTTTPPLSLEQAVDTLNRHLSGIISALDRPAVLERYLTALESDAPDGMNVDLFHGTLTYNPAIYTNANAARTAYASTLTDLETTARRIAAETVDTPGLGVEWTDLTYTVTGHDARKGNWERFRELVGDGAILIIRNRGAAGPGGDLAAAVDPNWVKSVMHDPRAPYVTTTEDIGSFQARQHITTYASRINAALSEGRHLHVRVHLGKRTAHNRTVAYTAGETPVSRRFQGFPGYYESVRLVPLPWLAQALNTTVDELKAVAPLTRIADIPTPADATADAG